MNNLKFIFSIALVAISPLMTANNGAPHQEGTSTAQKVFIGIAIGSGATIAIIVAGPVILPAGTVLAAKSAAGAIAVKTAAVLATAKTCAVSSATAAGIAAASISVGRIARPYVISTAEEKLNAMKKEDSLKAFNARKDLIDCLMKHGANTQGNNVIIPDHCQETAFTFELLDNEQSNY